MTATWRHVGGTAKTVLKGAIYVYQLLLSPVLGNNCRFHPNCSSYAMEAVDQHGPLSGSWMAVRRICRCNPWHPGGVDPVPEHPDRDNTKNEPMTLAPGGSAGQ